MALRYFLCSIGLISTPLLWTNAALLAIQHNVFSYIDQPATASPGLVVLGGYRLYNTSKGHFLKQDSFTPFIAEKTANGFDYGAGNPVLLADKTGHESMPISWLDLSEEAFADTPLEILIPEIVETQETVETTLIPEVDDQASSVTATPRSDLSERTAPSPLHEHDDSPIPNIEMHTPGAPKIPTIGSDFNGPHPLLPPLPVYTRSVRVRDCKLLT